MTETHYMKFKEGNTCHEQFPDWVTQLIKFGYNWPRDRDSSKQRIALISMPADSAAAGLIALGAMRKDLERLSATNKLLHYQAILKVLDRKEKNPNTDWNEWDIMHGDVKYVLCSKEQIHGEWMIKCKDTRNTKEKQTTAQSGKVNGAPAVYKKQIIFDHGKQFVSIPLHKAVSWKLRGYAIPQVMRAENSITATKYDLPCFDFGDMQSNNLSESYDGLILIGVGAGRKTGYSRKLDSISIDENPLGNLLTIHDGEISPRRVTLINQDHVDAGKEDPNDAEWSQIESELAIADGINAIQKVLESKRFQNSDVIGVYGRTSPAENLSNFSTFWQDRSRYYDIEEENTIGNGIVLKTFIEK